MILWIMVFLGTLIFVSGLYLLIKNYNNGNYIKAYGFLTYAGFAMVLLGVILLMEPVFTSLSGNLPKTVPLVIAISTSIIASKLLLEPTFLKNKIKKGVFIKNCTQCNKRFSFYNRLKAFINGHLKCSNCNTIYEPKHNVERGIYVGIMFIANIIIFNHIIILNNFMLQIKLQTLMTITTFPLFDLLPHRWQRYEKIS
jgi:CXXC-20-CXXC protein